MRFDIWVDGASSGNHVQGKPRRAGAGIVACAGQHCKEWAVPLGDATNQQAELIAVREALRHIKDRGSADVVVYSDSAYAIGCLTKPWKPKANLELIQETQALIAECHSFRMVKVAGHTGDPKNERANELAVSATRQAP
ncbi:MAG: reverse transcriptase-like protein [Armatimonadetes bacterium]|nr:reverse transcriptase-like protein [Armatimonadota bacterium]